jgi:hypothetical protein
LFSSLVVNEMEPTRNAAEPSFSFSVAFPEFTQEANCSPGILPQQAVPSCVRRSK